LRDSKAASQIFRKLARKMKLLLGLTRLQKQHFRKVVCLQQMPLEQLPIVDSEFSALKSARTC
jgi:hypothetical protein